MKVIEVGGKDIAVAYAGWLLAGMGAKSTLLESYDGGSTALTPASAMTFETMAQGKRRLPFPETATDFFRLADDADVLLCSDPQALSRLAGGVAVIRARCPRLTIGVATVFGITGANAGVPATELDAQAVASVSWVLGEPGRAPLSFPAGVLSHQAGAVLASGCLLSSIAVARGAQGQLVDVALADVLASYVAGNCRFYVHHGLEWQRSGRRASGSGGAYPFVILPCKDGDVCVCGRTRGEWERLVAAMGSPAWASESRYQRLRAMGQEYPDEVDELVMPWFARHSKSELETIALEHNLIVSPLRELHEVLNTPHFNASGFLQSVSVGGASLSVPTLPFKITAERSEVVENHVSTVLDVASPSKPPQVNPSSEGPLAGIRVLDLGWVWSAPWVSTFLSELGAEVVKVENGSRPDNLRLAGRVVRDGQVIEGPSKEMSPMYHQVNHGKLGVTLNLKQPRARSLLKQLVKVSDVLIENMSPGSLERSELGYDVFKALNPKLVMLAMSAAGQFGELSGMRAYAPTMSSFVGLEALIGYQGEPPLGSLNFALSDPSAAVHGLVPLLAALRRAQQTGEGCYIDLSQTEALLGTLRPQLIESQLSGEQPVPQGNGHEAMCPHGIYPTAEDGAWLTIAVGDDEQWSRLAAISGVETLANNTAYQSGEGRRQHREQLDSALATWTMTQPRDQLVAALRTAGIASSPVLSLDAAWRDAQFVSRGLKSSIEIPYYGPDEIFQAPWRFSGLRPKVAASGPTLGQHNKRVFEDLLGLSTLEVEDLEREGVIA